MKKTWLVRVSLLALLAAPPVLAAAPVPVVVAESENFEIVGRLFAGELVLHVDEAPSNRPVSGAQLEVEVAGRTMGATFDPASGDYRIRDAAWLKPLQAPGTHTLGFTLITGDGGDLLGGTLVVEPAAGAGGETLSGWGGMAAGLAGLLLLAGGLALRKTRRSA